MRAAAEIWMNGLTNEFTCQLGHPSLCGFVFYMQLFLFNHRDAGLKAARILKKLSELSNSSKYNLTLYTIVTIYESEVLNENVLNLAKKLSMRMFDYLSKYELEAKFQKAEMIVSESPEGRTEALRIWDDIITESWNGNIDFRNLLPAIISKYRNWF